MIEKEFASTREREAMNAHNHTQVSYMADSEKVLTQFQRFRRVIPFVVTGSPDSLSGRAHRVGYTPAADGQQALYRLKLCKAGRKGAALPGFFLLVDGAFVQYAPSSHSR